MTIKGNILVGTVGQGVMMSADDGESWTRASVRQGMHSDSIVRMLRADARRPEVVYAGTDMGLYRSDDRGMKWRLLDNPMKGSVVWSVAIDPIDPAIMFAGTGTPSKPGIFRSTDGAKSWGALRVAIADDCPNVGIPRPTGIAVDPTNDRNVWVGLEVDGVRYSTDGGDTWARVNGQIPNQDVHNVLVVEGPPKTVFTVVNDFFGDTATPADFAADPLSALWQDFVGFFEHGVYLGGLPESEILTAIDGGGVVDGATTYFTLADPANLFLSLWDVTLGSFGIAVP